MHRRRQVDCAGCGAVWDARRARYCGSCGSVLAADPAPEPSAVPARWRRRLVGAGVAVLGAALVGALFVVGGDLELPGRAPDPAVALPEATAPSGPPLSPQERAAALEPFDPDRLACRPTGCERWRVDLGDQAAGRPLARIDDGLIVAATQQQVQTFDADTGERRWSWDLPTPSEHPARGSASAPHRGGATVLGADEQAVVVAGHDTLHLLDADGTWRWSAPIPAALFPWQALPSGDRVVVHGQSTGGDGSFGDGEHDRLAVLDRDSGALRWSREVAATFDLQGDVLVVREDRDHVTVLDWDTGEPRLRIPAAVDAWLQGLGPWLLHHTADEVVVLDASDGTELLALDASVQHTTRADGRYYAAWASPAPPAEPRPDPALAPGAIGDVEAGVIALDDEGVRWSRSYGTRSGDCCLALTEGPDGDLLLFGGDDPPLLLDPATGDLAPDQPDGRVPQDRQGPLWWPSSDLAVEHRGDRLWLWRGDASIEVRGGAWPISLDPLVVTDGSTLLGLDLAAAE